MGVDWKQGTLRVALTVLLLANLFPLFWMLAVSLERGSTLIAGLADLWPEQPSLRNYLEMWQSGPFGRYFLNSFVVAAGVTAGNLVFCTMAGYAFARRRFPLKRTAFGMTLATMMLPAQIIMVPLYVLIVKLGWFNTYWALIVPWLVNPFGVFLMKQYIQSLPVETEQAARIDGASELQVLWYVVAPLARPALVVLLIYVFMSHWNSFLFPFLFTNEDAMRTLPVGLAFYQGQYSIDWPHLMAGSATMALPMIGLFLIFQRQIIAGLTAGAVKG
jgi:multiple sugar transport system permease protein